MEISRDTSIYIVVSIKSILLNIWHAELPVEIFINFGFNYFSKRKETNLFTLKKVKMVGYLIQSSAVGITQSQGI